MDLNLSDQSDNELERLFGQEHNVSMRNETMEEKNSVVDDVDVRVHMEEHNVPNVPVEKKPYIGREFQSVDLAYNFYNAYGRLSGFSVRKDRSWNRKGGVSFHQFVCSKEGTRKASKDTNVKLNKRAETRCGCKAMVEFMVINGIYRVRRFTEEHNHVLFTPSKAHLLRSSKKMSDDAKGSIENRLEADVMSSQSDNVMTTKGGGSDELSYNEENIKAHIRQIARETYGNDARKLVDYFRKKQEENRCFFYALQFDETGQLCNCFWVDARAQLDYCAFGDVVSFDTIYKKNKYLVPFAPFTGVNNHLQSITFGCALLVDETEASFVWLFEEWLRAMGNRHPRAIITDRDPVMKAAIAKVFPDTVHRFCLRHILQEVPKKLYHVYRDHPNFKDKWNKCIYKPNSIEEFEELWLKVIQDFKLDNIDWLKSLWDIRHMWVPAYLKDVFFAGMSTIHRARSKDDFFKDWVDVNTTLNDFVRKYDMAIEKQRELEIREDFNSVNAKPVSLVHSRMEEQLQILLTKNMFCKFQEELLGIGSCLLGSVQKDDLVKKYKILQDFHKKDYIVSYVELDQAASCSCRKFNFEGIVCRHIFFVFRIEGVIELPSCYILKRWRKDARNGVAHDDHGGIALNDDCQKSRTMRHNDLMVLTRCVAIGAMSDSNYVAVKGILQKFLIDIESINKKQLLLEAIKNEGTQAGEVNNSIAGSVDLASSSQN